MIHITVIPIIAISVVRYFVCCIGIPIVFFVKDDNEGLFFMYVGRLF